MSEVHVSLTKRTFLSVCLVGCGHSSNSGIRELPAELAQLSSLWQLDIENLNVTNVPQDVRKEGIECLTVLLFYCNYPFKEKSS